MINKGERAELRSIVKQQFKVLRAEVAQREAEDGRVCLSTALGMVNGFGTWTWREQAVLREVAAVQGDDDIIDFNDDPFTSYETVILALKRAHEASEA